MKTLQSIEGLLVLISFLVGVIQTFSPDHWVPLSLMSWKKRWDTWKNIGVVGVSFFFHILSGFFIFLLFRNWLLQLSWQKLLILSEVSLLTAASLRWFRFTQRKNVLVIGQNQVWGGLTVLSLLGPSESLVPILVKSHQMGTGYLLPLIFFGVGSWLAGVLLVRIGKFVWNRPLLFTQTFGWIYQKGISFPMTASLLMLLSFALGTYL